LIWINRVNFNNQEVMNRRLYILLSCFFILTCGSILSGQTKIWTVDDCIQYALDKNIQVQKAMVSNSINEENLKLAKSA
jgi:hypothetical protein